MFCKQYLLMTNRDNPHFKQPTISIQYDMSHILCTSRYHSSFYIVLSGKKPANNDVIYSS